MCLGMWPVGGTVAPVSCVLQNNAAAILPVARLPQLALLFPSSGRVNIDLVQQRRRIHHHWIQMYQRHTNLLPAWTCAIQFHPISSSHGKSSTVIKRSVWKWVEIHSWKLVLVEDVKWLKFLCVCVRMRVPLLFVLSLWPSGTGAATPVHIMAAIHLHLTSEYKERIQCVCAQMCGFVLVSFKERCVIVSLCQWALCAQRHVCYWNYPENN